MTINSKPQILSTTGPKASDLAIVGAGLGGLIAAVAAAKRGLSVVVFDPSNTGGRAATDVRNGFTFNRGPHALYESGAALRILNELGVACAGEKPPITKSRLLLGDTTIPFVSPKYLGARGVSQLATATRELMKASPPDHALQTCEQYLDTLELLPKVRLVIESLIRTATFSHAFNVMSADVAISQYTAAIKGVRYVDGGWGTIVRALRSEATRLHVRFVDERVTEVQEQDAVVTITTDGNESLAKHVLLAQGTAEACSQIIRRFPSQWHKSVPPVLTTHLDLGLSTPPKRLVVFGLDTPAYAVTHHPPADLAPKGGAVVHLMRTIHPNETVSLNDEKEFLENVAQVIGVDPATRTEERYLHRMVAVSALITPDSGGMAGRPTVCVPDSQRLFVAGDWVGSGWLTDAVAQSAIDVVAAITQSRTHGSEQHRGLKRHSGSEQHRGLKQHSGREQQGTTRAQTVS
jgi:phytoene dehydrogenase-like protein